MEKNTDHPELVKPSGKTFIILIITGLEILGILFLLYRLFFVTKVLIKKISITPIDKSGVSFSSLGPLKYFYENEKNLTLTDILPWEKNKKQVAYSLNEDGLNSLENYSTNKPGSTFRIVALGDSFTFGQSVTTKYNWPTILESLLNKKLACDKFKKYEVINLGVRDYDIRYAVEEYKIKGKKYNPDLIIWFLKDDDFMTINEYEKPILNKLIKKMKISLEDPEFFIKNGISHPVYLMANSEFKNKYGESRILLYQQDYLNNIYEYFKKSLVLFTLGETDSKYKKIMIDSTKKHKSTYFIDGFRGLYNQNNNPTLDLPDGHPNNNGHQKIAEYLFNYLIKDGPIKNGCL